jgi:hypothetical protein
MVSIKINLSSPNFEPDTYDFYFGPILSYIKDLMK